ncbi:cyclophilin-like fold protein [Gordonibacter sp. 28C]|uniref:cyclophilin-like fold protein n=1 Tax=Gordonibacter sp. 28C TaxID=2078569 RepID=UPI0018F3B942|nr:cyclophilin-like fold protein [Gordonibacter sp. 28C]
MANAGKAATFALLLAAGLALGGCAASDAPAPQGDAPAAEEAPGGERAASVQEPTTGTQEGVEGAEGEAVGSMLVTIDGQEIAVTLDDNETARAFAALLPLELDMLDVNGNEKFAALADPLPSHASAPGRIEAGDLMLYGDDGVVLFYESFSSSYSYTRLGRVDDPSALASVADAASVRVTFERA